MLDIVSTSRKMSTEADQAHGGQVLEFLLLILLLVGRDLSEAIQPAGTGASWWRSSRALSQFVDWIR
jgi:hypothetical protein